MDQQSLKMGIHTELRYGRFLESRPTSIELPDEELDDTEKLRVLPNVELGPVFGLDDLDGGGPTARFLEAFNSGMRIFYAVSFPGSVAFHDCRPAGLITKPPC